MKALFLVLSMVLASSLFADVFTVTVTRIDKDIYKTTTGFIIITKYCYEYSYSDDAILKFEKYGYDNKLIFDHGTCEVDKVLKQ